MKAFFVSILALIGCTSNSQNTQMAPPNESIYNLSFTDIDGNLVSLNQFKGKKILIINTASKCGFTPQYEELQKLHVAYPDLVMIGFPCNQFMGQEPGNSSDIKSFCTKNYGVSFLMTEKIDVKGKNQHPVYQWLTQKSKNGVENSTVSWNFNKYLISENGTYLAHFQSSTQPMSQEIIQLISKK